MKKKLMAFLLYAVIISCIPVAASAQGAEAQIPSIAAAYRDDNALYAFIEGDFSDEDVQISTQELAGKNDRPLPLLGSGVSLTYVILLDTTQSMQSEAEEIKSMASSLMDSGLCSRLIVAPFCTELLTDNVIDTGTFSDADTVRENTLSALSALEYKNDSAYSAECVMQAIDNADKSYPASVGNLVNLILVTDAFEGEKNLNNIADEITDSPEIILHTVMVGGGKAESGTGVNTALAGNKNGAAVAEEIINYEKKLYKVVLPYTSEDTDNARTDITLYAKYSHVDGTFETKSLPVVSSVPLMVSENGGVHTADAQLDVPASTDPSAADNANETTPTEKAPLTVDIPNESASPDAPESSEPPVDGTEGEMAPEESGAPQSEANLNDGVEPAEAKGDGEVYNAKIWIIIATAVLAVAIVTTTIIVMKKRGGDSPRPDPNAIPMKLEVKSGNCKTKRQDFLLSGRLIIGRDKSCDIRFVDPDISARNTKIYIRNGFIYIEDMNSTNGTYLEGMRISMANRLRSGDEISIGGVRFCFFF